MYTILTTISIFIQDHTIWLYAIVFFAALLESIAFVGSIIPGGTIVALSGAFVVTNGINIVLLIFLATIGAILGDAISFYLGSKNEGYFNRDRKFLKRSHIEYAKKFFYTHGSKSIILGRFMGITRALIPMIAGVTGMNKRKFLFWNIVGAILWSISHVFIGYFLGGSLVSIERWSSRIGLFVLLICGIIIVVWFILNKSKHLVRFWYGILSIISLVLLYNLTDAVFGSEPITILDANIHDVFLTLRNAELITFFKYITALGNWQVVAPLMIGITILLYYKSKKYIIPLWVSAVSAESVAYVIKILTHRSRPLDSVISEQSFSFPSGHATIAVALYGFIAFILLSQKFPRKIKQLILFVVIILILFIGLSRLYLGVHFISDVLGGYLVGSLGLLLGMYIYVHRNKIHTFFTKNFFIKNNTS